MNENISKDIPNNVINHLKKIQSHSNLTKDKDILGKLVESWLSKRALFDRVVEHKGLVKTAVFLKDNKNGCIAITMSGSLVAIGPMIEGYRKINYLNIGIRTDIAEKIFSEKSILKDDIKIDNPASFEKGPIKSTSNIIDIAMIENIDFDIQDVEIEKTQEVLTTKFLEANMDIYKKEYDSDDIKKREDLFKRWIILEWFKIGGLQEQIFLARAKLLWVELFSDLYKKLNKLTGKELDNAIVEFSNNIFSKFIDDYKWYESEKKQFDIGLMKALEELPGDEEYKTYLEDYTKKFLEVNP